VAGRKVYEIFFMIFRVVISCLSCQKPKKLKSFFIENLVFSSMLYRRKLIAVSTCSLTLELKVSINRLTVMRPFFAGVLISSAATLGDRAEY